MRHHSAGAESFVTCCFLAHWPATVLIFLLLKYLHNTKINERTIEKWQNTSNWKIYLN